MEHYIPLLIELGRTDLEFVNQVIHSYLNQFPQAETVEAKRHLSEFLKITQKIYNYFPYDERKQFSQRSQKDELQKRIASYEKQINNLKKETKDYEIKVTEYKDTISKMMMAQEIGRVDGNENLMDKYRPSYIKEHFRSLYMNSYGDLDADIENLRLLDDDKERCQVLLDILFDAFKLSGDYSQEGKRNANFHLTSLFSSDPFNKKEKVITKYMQESICNNLKENPDPQIQEEIKKKVIENMNSHLKTALNNEEFRKSLESYVSQCVDVTWLMQCSNPPLFISTEMKKFNKNLHQRDSGKGQYVEYYLWPTLFSSKEQFQRYEASFDKGAVHLTDKKTESPNNDQAEHDLVTLPRKEPKLISTVENDQLFFMVTFPAMESVSSSFIQALSHHSSDNQKVSSTVIQVKLHGKSLTGTSSQLFVSGDSMNITECAQQKLDFIKFDVSGQFCPEDLIDDDFIASTEFNLKSCVSGCDGYTKELSEKFIMSGELSQIKKTPVDQAFICGDFHYTGPAVGKRFPIKGQISVHVPIKKQRSTQQLDQDIRGTTRTPQQQYQQRLGVDERTTCGYQHNDQRHPTIWTRFFATCLDYCGLLQPIYRGDIERNDEMGLMASDDPQKSFEF